MDSPGVYDADRKTMKYSVMFFSSEVSVEDPYRFLLDVAQYADENGFAGIWTPERHFEQFGGLFPNPALTSAAIAPLTRRIQLRAGSLISPLHDVIRIAEEWAVVDVISGGRAAVSFGSGWNANDFVLSPDIYGRRHEYMLDQINQLELLWQGETITRTNGCGREMPVKTMPRPIQSTLPIWLTSSGNLETFKIAGRRGYNLLTHMIMQDRQALKRKIEAYREARAEAGHDPATGYVSLMLHTYLGFSDDEVRELTRPYLREYLRSAVMLEQSAAKGGGTISGGQRNVPHEISPDIMDELLDMTFDRYFDSAALMGTLKSARRISQSMSDIGVDEIACLIDFGLGSAEVLRSLKIVASLQ